ASTRRASATVSITGAARRDPVSRSVSRSRKARSKRALCATRTESPAKERNSRTARAGGGAPRSCRSLRPVSAETTGPSGTRGSTSVSYSSTISNPAIFTAPISQICELPGRRPVVSRSTTTYTASSRRRSAPSGCASATASPDHARRASASTTSARTERASATGAWRRANSRRAASSATTGPRRSSTSSTRRSAASSLSCMAESLGEHTFVFQLTPLRAEPRDEAEQVTQVLPGEPVRVRETYEEWALVSTAYDYPGWLRLDALGGEGGKGWLEPTASTPLEHARGLLGAPYLWGGMTSLGIDCSGLVHMSHRAVGRLVPRDADQQEQAGTPVEAPEPGDLVTYGTDAADHIAFWTGDGRILHATQREGVSRVVEEPEPEELRARRRRIVRL